MDTTYINDNVFTMWEPFHIKIKHPCPAIYT